MNRLKLIAFDADDTLWDCQGHFEKVMQQLYNELQPWADRERSAQELFSTERKNMPLLGFGVKAFTLSMLETAMRVSHNEMSAARLSTILQACYSLLTFPTTPLPGVVETLRRIREDGRWRMVVFTKGELQDQENKLKRSGLADFFDDVEITSDKTQHEFLQLCWHQDIHPSEMLMVGNSLKSDIAPALAIGSWAVHIPFHVTWELEHTESFDHPRLFHIDHFSALAKLINLPEGS